ncbi:MAG: hypothetical protein K9L70_03770 [Thiohalocapsa sp.]|nr:hypothetical protein [Thiohalocapsa sp.]MCF7989981.1 hypothetical protein [Thiohalocapsa sp.]
MEQFDARLHGHRRRAFDAVPKALHRRVFGVDYLQLRGRQSGDLYVTRHGWPVLDSIEPSQWFVGERLRKIGRQLAGATGAVYRVPVPHRTREKFALVVKFSRFAQEALVSIAPDAVMDWAERDRIAASEFLSPFEEFAHVERLRARAGARIPTKAPLAIYSPSTRYLDWQLGRRSHRRWWYDRVLAEDQADQPEDARIAYGWERMYILLYRWIDGIDAETAHQQGYLTEPELRDLSEAARQDLRGLGWDVLDHKPRHLIVRPAPDPGRLMWRGGRILWALVDYELLVPYPAAGAAA